ncbi:hypothetical protein KAH55_01515 [bacterium]|nr:hypothetical protein [bacterium]
MKLSNRLISGGLLLLILLGLACSKNPFDPEKKDEPLGNKAPETYLFLFPAVQTAVSEPKAVGIDTTASKQALHWWGDDPDGEVIGYYYQWDYMTDPVFTTAEYDTFYVPIRTKYDQFSFSVWAVDNDSLSDATPAVQVFPVFNSTPTIEFRLNSNPTAPAGQPDVIAYTFPTRTFMWDALDPDGRETITSIFYALDDTSDWVELSGTASTVTLSGLEAGEHNFYIKAVDIAGAQSDVLSFPDVNDKMSPNTWIVKKPQGDVLLVNDFAQDQNTHQVQGFYENILQNIVGAEGYSVWEIGTSRTPEINPQNRLPYATADIKAYLNYFKKVIWFSHLGRPNLATAGLSLTQYIGDGGKVFISNANEEIPDTSWTFTSIDSVYRLNPGGRLLPGINVLASLTNSPADTAMNLNIGRLVGNRVSALVPGDGAEVIYRMEADTVASVSVPYKGEPVTGIRYRVGAGESIYFSLPLHFCDGRNNVEAVLRYILLEEFE